MRDLLPGCVDHCEGCSHRRLSLKASKSKKLDWLKLALNPWANHVEEIRGILGNGQLHYRRKVCLHAQWNKEKHQWLFGLIQKTLKRENLFKVIHIPSCPVHHELIQNVVQFLSQELPPDQEFPLRYLVISGSILTFVLKSHVLPVLPEFEWGSLGLTGVYINLHPSAGNRVFSNRGWHFIWGYTTAKDSAGFLYGPQSFQQLIPELYEDSLSEVEAYFSTKKGDAIVDLYSGIGRSLFIWNQKGIPFTGVELNGEAWKCSLDNMGFSCSLRGRVSDRIPQLNQWLNQVQPKRLMIYANPPRVGMDEKTIQWICKFSQPFRIAYLSCSAGTLRRDLREFSQSGYVVDRIIPYDFFPQTHHVETLTFLEYK